MAFLTIMTGEDEGRIDPVINDEAMLGRSPDCDIQYADLTVSRRHAQITREGDAFFIMDLNSQHGTVVDGRRIVRRERITHGALIDMGACSVKFEAGRAPADHPPAPQGGPQHLGEHQPDGDDSSSGTAILDAMATIESHRQSNDHKLRAMVEIMHNVGVALDIETIFPKILECMLTLFPNAERACIQLLDEDGELRIASSWGRGGQEPEFLLSRSLVKQVLAGKAIVSDDAIDQPGLNTESVYRLGLRSLMCAPLVNEGEKVGLIYVDSGRRMNPFQQEDLHVLITIGNLAARGLGRARLHAARIAYQKQQQDLQLARELQLHFLPRELPEVDNYELATFYEAAYNVGGDYLGCLPLRDGRLALIVADVAGKGMSAALVMARLCSDVRYSLSLHDEAQTAVQWLSDQMNEDDEYGRFITMALGILDPRTHQVQLANAGHPPPLLRTAEGVRRWKTEMSGPPLGVRSDAVYQQEVWKLAEGDCLLMHSDGANEAESSEGEFFGLPRVAETLAGTTTAEDAVNSVRDAVKSFMSAQFQPDDLCILAVMRRHSK